MGKKSAFTMVELIFVIVILGILAAVAVPKMNASRDDAKIAASIANLKVLMTDLQTYHLAKSGGFEIGSGDGLDTNACSKYGGSMTGTPPKCTNAKIKDLTKFTSVTLRQDKSSNNIYFLDVGKDDGCLKLELEDTNTLKVTPLAKAPDKDATPPEKPKNSCERFLAMKSVQGLLKGQKAAVTSSMTKQEKEAAREPKTVAKEDANPAYFDFSASSISGS